VGEPDRAEAMARRLQRTTALAGLDESGRRGVEAAFRAAMEPRIRLLPDDHHPAYLHPARTVLILLSDLGIRDPAVLAAGALCETLDPHLATPSAAAATAAGPRAAALLRQVPAPASAGERLLESLVTADAAALLVALAERLDHARHLHLRDAADHAPLHHQTCAVYLPLAARAHPVLDRRYRWWCRTFAARFLPPPPPG
jgi:(p)ppGpp synthase/HD superfamily hydrolase